MSAAAAPRTCRSCGCTEGDCALCVSRTGEACWWVEADLCSACALPALTGRLAGLYKPSDVAAWLAAPQPQLGGLTAIKAIADGRADAVHAILDRLDDAVFL